MKPADGPLPINLALKALLVALVLFPLAAPNLPQFAGKAMGARALTYPLAALVVPAIWWLRGRPRPYADLPDILFVLPFVIDLGGNAANLYNTVPAFDDLCHFFNWALLVSAFGAIMVSLPIGRLNAFALTVGFGATSHIFWEIAEYLLMKAGSSGLQLTYDDTMGDFILSFGGTLVGAVVTVTWLWKRRDLAGRLFGSAGAGPSPARSDA